MNKELHDLAELLRGTKNNRKVICITGRLAAGKTYAMSALATELHAVSKLPVYSNYGLNIGSNIKQLDYVSLYTSEGYKLVCLDEGQNVAHRSARFMASLLSEFMEDKNLILILTAFNASRIDSETRKKIDIFIEVERTEEAPGSIRLSSGQYERVIEIDENNNFYDFCEIAETYL